ncbi:unnamed protein product [Closterium sp. Yama58-4]|nr:unnamed protein product [Closterium sp. Yama58-4]
MTHLRMGEQETATDYCNRAQRLLATIMMVGVQYSTASYVKHDLKGLTSNYNLLKRLSMAPSTRATLNEDSLALYILHDEAMQEAERSSELLPQVNYAAPAKQGGRLGQRVQSGGGGSNAGRSTKDTDKQNDSDDDDAKGGRGRSASRRPRRGNKLRKEKQSTKSTSAKDADSSGGDKGRDDKEASCSLVGVVEPTASLSPEAGDDFQAMAAAVQANPAVVLLDSGCSHHLMGTNDIFVDLEPSGDVKHVRGFNGALQDVHGRGTVALQGEAGKRVLIPDVLYVPGVHANLQSAGQLKENGVKLQDDGDEMLLVSATGDVLGRATYSGRVLCTDLRHCLATNAADVVALRAIVSATKSTPNRLHARLAYVGMDTIRSSAKHEVAIGLDLKSTSGSDSPCVSCVGGKLARHTFPDKGSDAVDALAVVHIDLCGPFRVAAKDGSLYFLLLKDRKTRYVWVRPVAKKSDVLQEFMQWLVVAERQTKKSVLMLRSDRGGEFLGKDFTAFVDGKCIVHVLTCPYAPQENGMAEREMRTVVESVRTMLLHMGANPPTDTSTATLPLLTEVGLLPDEDAEAVHPPSPSPSPVPPSPPLVTDLRELPSASASGYERSSGASPVAPAKSIAGGRRNVQQGRKSMQTGEGHAEEVQPTLVEPVQKASAGQQLTGEQAAAKPTIEKSATGQSAGEPTAGEKSAWKPTAVQQDSEGSESGPRRTGRLRRPPDFFIPAAFTTVYDVVDDDMLYDAADDDEDLQELDLDMHADPEHRWDISTMTVKEALASWKGEAVKAAMEEEIRSLISMGTWELVERPPGVNIMKNRWVLMTKYCINNTVEREKARLVVKGFTQVYGADYDETYAPVSSYVMLRIFLSIVAVLDLNLMQLDMKNAFLQSKLDHVLYMYQPDYFNDGTGRVCKLLKSLYGLKQSPLLWYKALNDVLVGAGWKCQIDEALYFKVGTDKMACWVLVYVDDLLAASSSTAMLKELKELLEAAFKLLEISPVHNCVGASSTRSRAVEPQRRRYLLMPTPIYVDAYAELTFDDEEAQKRQEEEYRQKVGSLQFAATTTRPDIAFTCSKLGSGLTVRSDQHWREVDRCLAYLANTRDTALEFGGGPETLELVGYVDADDVSDKQIRTSTGGYVFVYGGAAVSWSTEKHQVRDAVVDRVGVCGGNGSRQGGTPPSLPPRRVPAAGRQDAYCPPGGQQVGHHGRRGHGVDGQPQAHGAATGLAAAHGEAGEVFAAVHPDHRPS